MVKPQGNIKIGDTPPLRPQVKPPPAKYKLLRKIEINPGECILEVCNDGVRYIVDAYQLKDLENRVDAICDINGFNDEVRKELNKYAEKK